MLKERRSKNIHVLMSPTEAADLAATATYLKVSYGHMLRQLSAAAHRMVCLDSPCCATGQRCFVPNMHALPAPDPEKPTPAA